MMMSLDNKTFFAVFLPRVSPVSPGLPRPAITPTITTTKAGLLGWIDRVVPARPMPIATARVVAIHQRTTPLAGAMASLGQANGRRPGPIASATTIASQITCTTGRLSNAPNGRGRGKVLLFDILDWR
jgi:hypothetical protein